jgi:Spy/CpxP family protein refolding chaperone
MRLVGIGIATAVGICALWTGAVVAQTPRCQTYQDVYNAFQPARRWNDNFNNHSQNGEIKQQLDALFARARDQMSPHQNDADMSVACGLLAKFLSDFNVMRAQACQMEGNIVRQTCNRLATPFSDGTPSGCNYVGCNLDIRAYCMQDEMARRGCPY